MDDGSTEVKTRRFRYTGKERDEETGLQDHGARRYIPWLGRWDGADPAGFVDGTNRYAYVSGNPVRLVDPSGRAPISAAELRPDIDSSNDTVLTLLMEDKPLEAQKKMLSDATSDTMLGRAANAGGRMFIDQFMWDTGPATSFLRDPGGVTYDYLKSAAPGPVAAYEASQAGAGPMEALGAGVEASLVRQGEMAVGAVVGGGTMLYNAAASGERTMELGAFVATGQSVDFGFVADAAPTLEQATDDFIASAEAEAEVVAAAVPGLVRMPSFSSLRSGFLRHEAGLGEHLRLREPGTRRVGIKGAHNEAEFLRSVGDIGARITEVVQHPTLPGVRRYAYQIPAMDKGVLTGGYKAKEFYKSTYNPHFLSDGQFLKEGLGAAWNAHKSGTLGREWTGVSPRGISFRGYLNQNGAVRSFFVDF